MNSMRFAIVSLSMITLVTLVLTLTEQGLKVMGKAEVQRSAMPKPAKKKATNVQVTA